MTNNYAKVKTGKGWVYLFFDDRDESQVANTIERIAELGFSRVAVWRRGGLVAKAIARAGLEEGILEIGQVPKHIQEQSDSEQQ